MKNTTYGVLFVLVATSFALYSPVMAEESSTSTPEAATSTSILIFLDIETSTSTLFDGFVDVSACSTSASSTSAFSGYCAVMQSGVESGWSSYGEARFLDSVAGISADYDNGWYWGWFSDLEYGQTSLDQHVLVPGERLLVTMGRMPLRISLATTTPVVGATTTVSVDQFGFDDSWNGVWVPAASSSVSVGLEIGETDVEGRYDVFVSSSTPLTVSASKDGFLRTMTVAMYPYESVEELDPVEEMELPAPDAPATTTPQVSSGGSSGSGSRHDSCSIDVARAIQFVSARQGSDGSFGSSLYTDWAAIALASDLHGVGRDSLVSLLKGADDSLSSPTDYERRAMSLMAFGVDPRTGAQTDYMGKIAEAFDGVQVGDPSLVNDDIFAIIPLVRAGYSSSDPIIERTTAFVVSMQSDDGSWEGSVDLTAASVQALGLVRSIDGVSEALDKARDYLVSKQRDDGGFGSGFSTSWALQAIVSLGESGLSWSKAGKTPLDSLCSLQQEDGGFESLSADGSTRVWATSYAIPAALGRTWSSILVSFPKPAVESRSVSSMGDGSVTEEASSTPAVHSDIAAVEPSAIVPSVISLPVVEVRRDVTSDIAPDAVPVEEILPQAEVSSTESGAVDYDQTAAVGAGGISMQVWSSVVAGLGLIGLAVSARSGRGIKNN